MTLEQNTYHLDRFEALINKFRALDFTDEELTLFDVGTRGHFENPTTELLSFFLNSTKPHDLDDCFFKGLQSVIAYKNILSDLGFLKSVETEVSTQNGKRIDLLVETDTALIVIECKIYHHQNNPFDEYTAFGNERVNKDVQDSASKTLVKLVLCLNGNISADLAANGWHGISYNELVKHIEGELSQTMFDNPYNKWALFAREFLLHLKGLNTMTTINEEEISFLTENLSEFAHLSDYIYNNLMPKIGTKISSDLNASDLQDFECKVKHGKWYYYEPVIRFSNLNWTTGSDIVLWMKANDNHISHKINLHIAKQSDELVEQFKTLIGDSWFKSDTDTWYEVSNTYWGISWSFKTFDLDELSAKIVELMVHLNNLELNYRPALTE
ncbi:PD-(D/E)XK nuclease family protein [Psychrobacter sp. GP33]|uniref:PD-(D/E)XK nuclease family protein n=1 Tax=Psychrobacter sp. GP33 TaxID=2758709 RepID=UPI0015F7D57D|nr:PD-(D/E)XK nuclease family protein [Psychrobacter sp. GP33]